MAPNLGLRISRHFQRGHMPIKYWMISNREVVNKNGKTSLGTHEGPITFYTKQDDGTLFTDLSNWSSVSAARFQTLLVGEADKFPRLREEDHEEQKHVTLFVHGYNNTWEDAANRYQGLV